MGPIQRFIYKAEILQIRLVYLFRSHISHSKIFFLMFIMLFLVAFLNYYVQSHWVVLFAMRHSMLAQWFIMIGLTFWLIGFKMGIIYRKIKVNESMRLD